MKNQGGTAHIVEADKIARLTLRLNAFCPDRQLQFNKTRNELRWNVEKLFWFHQLRWFPGCGFRCEKMMRVVEFVLDEA